MDATTPMDPATPMDPDAQLGYLIARAGDLVSRRWFEELSARGINPRQFSVLSILVREPGISQAGLARRALITPQSMSELLPRLVAAGLIERGSTAPGRSASLVVADAGRALLARAYPIVSRLDGDAFGAMPAADRRELTRLLAAVIRTHAP